jgi:MFS family permease
VPIIAVILGILAGLASAACNFYIPQRAPEDEPMKKMVYGYYGILTSMFLAVAAILVCRLFFRTVFVWFGVTLCVTYVIALMAFFLQNIRLLKGNSEKK